MKTERDEAGCINGFCVLMAVPMALLMFAGAFRRIEYLENVAGIERTTVMQRLGLEEPSKTPLKPQKP